MGEEEARDEESSSGSDRPRESIAAAMPTILSAISHEFRTPLNAILGFAQLIAEDQSLHGNARRRAEGIEKAGNHLLRLVNEFLEMSLIESGASKVNSRAFDLSTLLHDVLALFEPEAESKHIKLALRIAPDTPSRVISDPLKLRQILINLVGNAVKFTKEGGVHLLVSAGDPMSDRCTLDVQVMDTGPGIEPSEAEQVFHRYARGRSSGRKEGAGLGLAISREYARLLGGELTLESTLGRGSVFRLAVPVTWVHFDSPDVEEFDGPVSSGLVNSSGARIPRTEAPLCQTPPSPEVVTRIVAAAHAGDRDVLLEISQEVEDEVLRARIVEMALGYDYTAIVKAFAAEPSLRVVPE